MRIDGVLGRFDLGEEIARLSPDLPSGRRSETLVKTTNLRVVLVTMRAGTELREHTAPGVITVQTIQGRFALLVDGTVHELAVGRVIALEGNTRHAVRAVEDGAFLLTIAWPGAAGEANPETR